MKLKRFYQVCGLVFAGFGATTGYHAARLSWGTKIDFDILGIIWLLESAPRLAAGVLTVFFITLAFACWVKAALVS